MNTWALILVHGAPGYYAAGREAALALLKHSPFHLAVAHDGGDLQLPPHPRLHPLYIPPPPPQSERPARFLLKFQAIDILLRQCQPDTLLLLDADAVLVRWTSESDLHRALEGAALGMVEQTTICGSSMARADFYDHYRAHTLAVLDPGGRPPALADFRYFNSGVVLGRAGEMAALSRWAIETIARTPTHLVGKHMVADQDYFQFWALQKNPGCCRTLPGAWNHGEYWDAVFPRLGARIVHFSNFCNGPDVTTPLRMRALWSGAPGFLHRHFGRFFDWPETPAIHPPLRP